MIRLPKGRLQIRKILSKDRRFLRNMLYEAIYVPEGHKRVPKSVLKWPEISRYVEGWGRSGDFGIIALRCGWKAGAAWCRVFQEENKGFGFVDAHTPELTIALKRKVRGGGIGTALMKEIFALARENGFRSISLSVDTRNRAADWYYREGFEPIRKKDFSLTMKKAL